jgi:putative heme-binding domain-containing protein
MPRRRFARFPAVVMIPLCGLMAIANPVLAAESSDGKLFTQVPEVAAAAGQAAAAGKEDPAIKKALAEGPAPSWIWGANPNKTYLLRKTFKGTGQFARLRATSDDSMTLYVNGKQVGSSSNWQEPVDLDIKPHLTAGDNVVEAEVSNAGGISGFVARIALLGRDGKDRFIVTDDSWEASEKQEPRKWVAAKVVSKLDDHPGGKPFKGDGDAGAPREVFNLLPGFQVERLFTVPKDTLGSWVNITTDHKGRLIVSDQGDKGLCRITPPPFGSQEPTQVELLDVKIGDKRITGAQGLLYAFDSLYVVCNGGPGSGLYRCRDTDGNDTFDEVKLLKAISGGGEHGPHAVRLSPDGKSLYVAAGNHTPLPFEVKTNAPPQQLGGIRSEQLRATLPEGVTSRIVPNWDEDTLLPRQWDAGGHAVGILAPGGWICKTDPDGKQWEIFSVGYRNQYDFAFNADGEMFAYDSDMEWDFGSPWYRPTRVNHVTSGSEFGWRSGTSNWPSYYIDSLPPMIDIGPGSPVGVDFGYGTRFPAKYQQALFICDWTFGTMYAIHIQPDENSPSTYKATKEEFVSRTPLPLTDCTVGKDGALYFTVGGRGAQSELFRVTYTGSESTQPVDARDPTAAKKARQERHLLEQNHVGDANPAATEELLKALGSTDRTIRYAARIGLERQPLSAWQDKIFAAAAQASPESLKQPKVLNTIIHGCVGLARQGEPVLLPKIVEALGKIDFAAVGEEHQLGLARAYQLAFIRLGRPDTATAAALSKKFDDLFPQKSVFVNRELSMLMIFFQSPGAVQKLVPVLAGERVASQEQIGELLTRNKGYGGTIAAMLANQPDLQQYHYAFHLRNQKLGWTPEARKTYFSWFDKARAWQGGASYLKFLINIDREAFESMSEPDRILVEASGARKPYKAPELPKAVGPGKEYTLDELIEFSKSGMKGRDFKNGQKMYAAARCVVCHRFGGDGGATGPDLTQAAGRFNFKDVAEAIVDPSKVVSDQYKTTQIETREGKAYTGRVVSVTADTITLLIDPEDSTKVVTIKKSDIEEQQLSAVSLMPKDLLKQLNQNEVLDLMAYLLSRGNPGDAMFRK